MIETIRIGDLTALRPSGLAEHARPVLFIHGYFADATFFTEWLPFFATRKILGPSESNTRMFCSVTAMSVSRAGPSSAGKSIDESTRPEINCSL